MSAETVRALVDDLFPQWRCLPSGASSRRGRSNAIFRIGEGSPQVPARARRRRLCAARWNPRRRLPAALASADVAARRGDHGRRLGRIGRVRAPSQVHQPRAGDRLVRAIDTCRRAFSSRGRGGGLRCHDALNGPPALATANGSGRARLRRTWTVMRSLPRSAAAGVMTQRRSHPRQRADPRGATRVRDRPLTEDIIVARQSGREDNAAFASHLNTR